ncbi:MAG: hypothetical protein J5679_00440 [Alphaproteobacteria bacterium]|nr:hypothetical protein [Alphaproteobacteria bacterium]
MVTVQAFIANIFTPTPIEVTYPRKFTEQYVDAGEQVEAYTIMVTYKNHKVREFTFPVDNDTAKEGAYMQAIRFYNRQQDRIRAYNKLHTR